MNKNGTILTVVAVSVILMGIIAFALYSSPTQAPITNNIAPNSQTTEAYPSAPPTPIASTTKTGSTSTVSASTTVGAKVNATTSITSVPPSTKSFIVNGGNFFFTPNTITVNKGDRVKITLNNTGGFHDFVIDEFNVRTPQIKDGHQATVEFIANKNGTFEYYCSIGEHRQMGMKGSLIVK